MKVRFTNKFKVVDNVWTFNFESLEKLDYIAGQFIELEICEVQNDGNWLKRWFTLSSSPTEEQLSISTRIDEKLSDFKKALWNLDYSQEVIMSQAMGDFVLPRSIDSELIFIGFGIGITPYRSMIKYLEDSNLKRNIRLLFINSRNRSLPFHEEFSHYLGDKVFMFQKSEQLQKQKILENINQNTYIFISGPEDRVMTERHNLVKYGIDENMIICDYFPGY